MIWNESEATGASELERRRMTTIYLNGCETKASGLQADLRESLGEQILLRLALDAVQSLDPAKIKDTFGGGPNLRPQMMLTLLAYCYATRTYGSLDIEWATRNDETVRYICARTLPDWRAIRLFRRKNRELLEQALTYVLTTAWMLQSARAAEAGPTNPWAEPGQWEKLGAEARAKIDTAILMDGVESD